jgi:hypothetical protein
VVVSRYVLTKDDCIRRVVTLPGVARRTALLRLLDIRDIHPMVLAVTRIAHALTIEV